jgi:hypothetical protein
MVSLAFMFCPDRSWLGEPKDYLFLLFGVIFGALVTVWWAGHEYRKSRLRELRLARDALLERLQFNDDRVVQMLDFFAQGKLSPDFALDTTGIIIWLSRSSGILTSETIKAVNWHRYQLDHINNKLSLFHLIKATGAAGSAESVRLSICEHLWKVHEGLAALRELLIKES